MSEEETYFWSDDEEAQIHEPSSAYAPLDYSISGEVMRVVYASEAGDYTVIRLHDSEGKEVTVVGSMPGVMEGQTIRATGRWELHKEHGRQFRVHSFQAVLPTSKEGIQRFLASGVLPGIGAVYAKRIVDLFGMGTLDVLDKASARLAEVPGLGAKRIREIKEAQAEKTKTKGTRMCLIRSGDFWLKAVKLKNPKEDQSKIMVVLFINQAEYVEEDDE